MSSADPWWNERAAANGRGATNQQPTTAHEAGGTIASGATRTREARNQAGSLGQSLCGANARPPVRHHSVSVMIARQAREAAAELCDFV
ncbi:hypothetical protein ANO11243_027450 [Dothideomycetidae sp. 11243]|nr:hypothetical protein ANO11243_027450 [fungal sp. No.11243]